MNKRGNLIVAIGDEIQALTARGVRLPASVRLLWEQYAGEYTAEKFAARHTSDNFFDENQPRDERGRFGEGGGDNAGGDSGNGGDGGDSRQSSVDAINKITAKQVKLRSEYKKAKGAEKKRLKKEIDDLIKEREVHYKKLGVMPESGRTLLNDDLPDAELLSALDLALDKLNA